MKQILSALACLTLVLLASSAGAEVIDFEDLYPGYETYDDFIPEDYAGFTWTSSYPEGVWGVTKNAIGNGYYNGTLGSMSIFAPAGWDIKLTADQSFDFSGAFITSTWTGNEIVTVEGWNDGILIYTTSIITHNDRAYWFDFDYVKVDTVCFKPSRQSSEPWDPWGVPNNIVVDNITYNISSSANNPLSNAGDNITILSKDVSSTVIQGTSTNEDPDDFLEYRWLAGEKVLLGWTPAGENGECPLDLSTVFVVTGTSTLTLEVTDGETTSSDAMILTVDNSAPLAVANGGGVYEINSEVTLGGSLFDFDGDLLEYQWMDGADVLWFGTIQTIAGGSPVEIPLYVTPNFSLGRHTILLRIDDGVNEPVTSSIQVEVVDTRVPTLAPVCNQTILWPPDHKMVEIDIETNAADNSGLPVTLTAVVASNEPEEGTGDGDSKPDWTEPEIAREEGIITLHLRAERSGSGDGREYTIIITAMDDSGNSSTADAKIIVPHNKGKK